jgi:hypothetical protein
MNVLDEQVLHSGLTPHRVFLETSVKVCVYIHLNPLRASTGITHHVFDGLWSASGGWSASSEVACRHDVAFHFVIHSYTHMLIASFELMSESGVPVKFA